MVTSLAGNFDEGRHLPQVPHELSNRHSVEKQQKGNRMSSVIYTSEESSEKNLCVLDVLTIRLGIDGLTLDFELT